MTHTKAFKGTPLEIGAQVFNEMCMPVVRSASNQGATPQALTKLYAGFVSACLGSMAADFGQDLAADVAQVLVDSFKTTDLGTGAKTQ